jgi:phage repressor protein C with HTH and peptisase S24 domain
MDDNIPQLFKKQNKHGGKRAGAGRKPKPDSKYSKDTSKSIRMLNKLATEQSRQCIEEIDECLEREGKDLFWLSSVLQQQGLGILRPTRSRPPIKFYTYRIYNIAAAASFNSTFADHDATDGGFEEVNLNELLELHPDKTIIVRVVGNSMIDAGIQSGDELVVEVINYPMQLPASGDTIVGSFNGSITVKKFRILDQKWYLFPQNEEIEPEEITEEKSFHPYGIVRKIIHSL